MNKNPVFELVFIPTTYYTTIGLRNPYVPLFGINFDLTKYSDVIKRNNPTDFAVDSWFPFLTDEFYNISKRDTKYLPFVNVLIGFLKHYYDTLSPNSILVLRVIPSSRFPTDREDALAMCVLLSLTLKLFANEWVFLKNIHVELYEFDESL